MPTPVTDAAFEAEVLQAKIPVLVDFWAPWCGPCKAMLPVLEELEKDNAGKVKIVKVNVDENGDTPGRFNVMSIPTFVLFKDGRPSRSFVGVRSKAEVQKEIDALLP